MFEADRAAWSHQARLDATVGLSRLLVAAKGKVGSGNRTARRASRLLASVAADQLMAEGPRVRWGLVHTTATGLRNRCDGSTLPAIRLACQASSVILARIASRSSAVAASKSMGEHDSEHLMPNLSPIPDHQHPRSGHQIIQTVEGLASSLERVLFGRRRAASVQAMNVHPRRMMPPALAMEGGYIYESNDTGKYTVETGLDGTTRLSAEA